MIGFPCLAALSMLWEQVEFPDASAAATVSAVTLFPGRLPCPVQDDRTIPDNNISEKKRVCVKCFIVLCFVYQAAGLSLFSYQFDGLLMVSATKCQETDTWRGKIDLGGEIGVRGVRT